MPQMKKLTRKWLDCWQPEKYSMVCFQLSNMTATSGELQVLLKEKSVQTVLDARHCARGQEISPWHRGLPCQLVTNEICSGLHRHSMLSPDMCT